MGGISGAFRKTRIPASRLLDEAMEDLLLKYKVITHKEKNTVTCCASFAQKRREEAFPPAFFCLAPLLVRGAFPCCCVPAAHKKGRPGDFPAVFFSWVV